MMLIIAVFLYAVFTYSMLLPAKQPVSRNHRAYNNRCKGSKCAAIGKESYWVKDPNSDFALDFHLKVPREKEQLSFEQIICRTPRAIVHGTCGVIHNMKKGCKKGSMIYNIFDQIYYSIGQLNPDFEPVVKSFSPKKFIQFQVCTPSVLKHIHTYNLVKDYSLLNNYTYFIIMPFHEHHIIGNNNEDELVSRIYSDKFGQAEIDKVNDWKKEFSFENFNLDLKPFNGEKLMNFLSDKELVLVPIEITEKKALAPSPTFTLKKRGNSFIFCLRE